MALTAAASFGMNFLRVALALPAGGLAALSADLCAAEVRLTGTALRENANGALAVLGLSVVPNETASTLSLEASSGDTKFKASQLGGAFTVSDEVPIYLEGFIGLARYDPTFVFSKGSETAVVSPKWTSITGTAGIGWDFRLSEELVLRPIFNFSLGHIESDLSLAGRYFSAQSGRELRFLQDGRLDAYGLGGSLMLDWERYREDYEIDVELRYTHIRLQTFGETSDIVAGHSDAITLGLWSRLRVPTGWTAFGGPIRAVGEFSGGAFIGDQAEVIDSPLLGQIGGGIEFDFAEVGWLPIERTRFMARYVFGRSITGVSLGLGITF